MRHRLHARVAAFLAASAAALLTTANALADDPTTADCLSANEHSIQLRADHKLRDARAELLICAAASCPSDVRNACTRRVMDVNAAIPTIVFEAKDSAGNDLTLVKVSMDGHPLLQMLEGIAISLDPGAHKFTFETPGQPPVEKTIVLQEAEKGRHVTVTVGAQSGPPEAPSVPASAAQTAPPPQPPTTATPPPAPFTPTPEPSADNAVHVQFSPPDNTSAWSLHASGGERLCRLPCTRWVAAASKYYVEKDEAKTEPLRIQVPDNLSYPVGSAVAARPNLARGSIVWPIVTGVVSAGVAAVGSVLAVEIQSGFGFDAPSPPSNAPEVAIAAVGVVGLAGSIVWLLWCHGDRLELGPLTGSGASVATTFTLRPTLSGLGGTF